MDHISKNWGRLNIDSIVNVLEGGTYIKSFSNLFLDYRVPSSSIGTKSIIEDGSLGLIRDENIRLSVTSF